MKGLIKFLPVFLLLSCSSQEEREDELLWEYYKTFSYAPEQMQALLKRARMSDTREFIKGLVQLERFDFDSARNTLFLDSAQRVFENLEQQNDDNYKGALGLALTFTEKGIAESDSARRSNFFGSAMHYYRKAYLIRPAFEPIRYYWARALFKKDNTIVNDSVLSLLEQVTRSKPTFFKAHERSAQFLAHYKKLGMYEDDPNHQIMTSRYRDANERIKYHFSESLLGDSSWYETYEGIADAREVYTIYERVHYLEQGIVIARKRKPLDTSALIGKRNEILIGELFNHDVLMDELISKRNLEKADAKMLLEVYYYQHDLISDEDKARLLEMIQSTASGTPYARYLSAISQAGTNNLVRNLDELINDIDNDQFKDKLKFEKAKELWRRGDIIRAKAILQGIASNYSTVGFRSQALLDYINSPK